MPFTCRQPANGFLSDLGSRARGLYVTGDARKSTPGAQLYLYYVVVSCVRESAGSCPGGRSVPERSSARAGGYLL